MGPPAKGRRLAASSMEPHSSSKPEPSIDDPNQDDVNAPGGRPAWLSQWNGSTQGRGVPTACRHFSVLTWRLLLEVPGKPGKHVGNRPSAAAAQDKGFPIGSLFFVEAEPTIRSLLSLEAKRLGEALRVVVELTDIDWSHSEPLPHHYVAGSSRHEDPAVPSGVLLVYKVMFEGVDAGNVKPFLHNEAFGSSVVAFLQDYFDQLYGVTRVSASVSDKIMITDDDGCSGTISTASSLIS